MLHVVDLPALHPGAGAQARPNRSGLAWPFRPSRPRPAAVGSDEQILARAGRLVLAARAARALTSTAG